MSIRRLPPLLVNQIAAGEVIERPASVVKELVENAIDAGAGQVDIAIEQGGKALIRIADDGCGIAFDELELAVAAHATSKITCAEDLDAIATMGFRGEALASIASVSHLTLLSRPTEQDHAGQIVVDGGTVGGAAPSAGAPGTTISVRTLFFNTPARRKFLKTDQTEGTRVVEMARTIALAHPEIGFTVRADDVVKLDLPPGQTATQRIIEVLGRELESELMEISAESSGVGIWGIIGTPAIARTTTRHLRVFINGRSIMDRTITHAVREAYRGLIEPTRTPTAALFLRMDPSTVDVNVHPTKAEVRLRNSAAVHGAIRSALRNRLMEADITPIADLSGMTPTSFPWSPGSDGGGGSAPIGAGLGEGEQKRQVVDYLRNLQPKEKGFVYSEMRQALASEAPELLDRTDAESVEAAPSALPTFKAADAVLQIHSSFIVTQDEQGMLIIDQHALHERVMFEKLCERLDAGPLESQRLLMPAMIELDTRQMEAAERFQSLLMKLGIDAQPMGPTTLAVHAFTTLLFERNVDPVAFLTDLFRRAVEEGLPDDTEAALHEIMDMMACKAAIKAGDRMEEGELSELLAYRERVERSSRCPHGRPTSLRMTIAELEKQFGRR